MRRVTWVRVSLLAVNVAVVVYLLWLIGEKAAERARRRHAIPSQHRNSENQYRARVIPYSKF